MKDLKKERTISICLRDPEIPKKIEGRITVLLDMNVWIDLAEMKTEQASRLQAKLRGLVESMKLFCPLPASIIWELFRQSYDSAVRVASLMEELSLNIAFAPSEEVFGWEVYVALQEICHGSKLPLESFALFVPILGHLSSWGSLEFPEPFRFGDPQEFADKALQIYRSIGLVQLCTMMQDSLPMPEAQAPAYADAALRRRKFTKGDKKSARKVEEDAILERTVIPLLAEFYGELPPRRQAEVAPQLDGLSEGRYDLAARRLLWSMPAARHFIDVQTVVGYDPRHKDKMRDFFDRELIMTPFVYSDVLVSRDRGIRHIVCSELREGIANTKRCIWTYEAFEEYLDSLASQTDAQS